MICRDGKACWRWYRNYDVWKTLIQFNASSDRRWNQGPKRPLSVGLVGYFKPQQWSMPSLSNLIWPGILLLSHLYISECLLSFTHSFPFSPALQGRHSRGSCFSCFLDEQTEAQRGGGPCHHPACMGGPGVPTVCVRQGRQGSQFLWWNPPTHVGSRLGESEATC